MDFSKRLCISYYQNIAVLNEEHNIYIVQHQETKRIFVKKKLDVFNIGIYQQLHLHPIDGIPQIVELYQEDSSLIVIEDYISGETLQEKINSRCLHEKNITHYIKELCNILIKLHSFNPPIIHRDIKPSNIIITPYNKVYLLDFNASKYFTDTKSTDTVLLGTKGYAAPEQYGFGFSTPQTDIYAVGMLLKELSSSLNMPTNRFNKSIAKCTQIDPSDRFTSIAELYKNLPIEPSNNNSNFQIKSWRDLTPPGFRTLTPWKIILSALGYLFLFWLCFSLEAENTTGRDLWIERVFFLMMFLSLIFTSTNYLNLQNIIPLCQHKNRFIHYLGIMILDVMFISVIMVSMIILESIL